jgi:hypothetical protein
MSAVHDDAVFDFAAIAHACFFAQRGAAADVAVGSDIGFLVDVYGTFNVGA